ncbi:hypothetical protein QS257_14810 [Terrilactibacillus sp. S3-3]|nr:hypothetical protein QS257_14810 [Terrilactibacillus sp. S3-3]
MNMMNPQEWPVPVIREYDSPYIPEGGYMDDGRVMPYPPYHYPPYHYPSYPHHYPYYPPHYHPWWGHGPHPYWGGHPGYYGSGGAAGAQPGTYPH